MTISTSIIAAGAFLALASNASAADFNCASARTETEAAVCSSAFLSHLDDRMARLFGWLTTTLDDKSREVLRDEQRLFLAFRDACGPDKSCLQQSYLTRNEDLSQRLKLVLRPREVS